MLSDNTNAVCAINNMDSYKSLLCDQEENIELGHWKKLFIIAAHIPGILNVEADQDKENQS